jgi:hypothetical protein
LLNEAAVQAGYPLPSVFRLCTGINALAASTVFGKTNRNYPAPLRLLKDNPAGQSAIR